MWGRSRSILSLLNSSALCRGNIWGLEEARAFGTQSLSQCPFHFTDQRRATQTEIRALQLMFQKQHPELLLMAKKKKIFTNPDENSSSRRRKPFLLCDLRQAEAMWVLFIPTKGEKTGILQDGYPPLPLVCSSHFLQANQNQPDELFFFIQEHILEVNVQRMAHREISDNIVFT